MAAVPRTPPAEARAHVASGAALLVSGYEEPSKFAAMHLEGALSYQDFLRLRPSLPKDREVIFYCA